ncbi:MAG: aspartate-semialdehyde dehydrogenase [Marinilabiliales bacterium]|nr:MAG: aspartate-semialdehyde dehydrogenase [Marinilabiliales bacterium]
MRVAVAGATGLVGGVMLKVLEERKFPLQMLIPVASERSAGKKIRYAGQDIVVITLEEALSLKPDIALFSAGGETSLQWARKFTEAGTVVIDNSSAWRMDPSVPLVVPEVNGEVIAGGDMLIANPNCSTIQMVMALAPLHREYGLQRIVVSTYQSVTGTGIKAVMQLENERKGIEGDMAYSHPIDRNCIPQCDVFLPNGYTKEEMKLVNETRKIFGDESIAVTATAVRVPVVGGHSESVTVQFKKDFDTDRVRALLDSEPGVVVIDDPSAGKYPMPLMSSDRDEVFVGRIRRDESAERSLNMWIVADNLRKGAATNTIQIAEYMLRKGLL